MNNLQKTLLKLKKEKRKAISVFLTAGYPNIKTTEKLILQIEKYANIIELGIPFSDPIADGPTIQYSSQKALENKINLEKCLSIVKNIRRKTSIPIVLMGYFNPVFNYDLKKFFYASMKAGVDGIIIPDIPYEESLQITKLAKKYNIAFIPIVALTSGINRAVKISKTSTGFIYVTAITGITGARSELSKELIPFLKLLKNKTNKHLLVGFGISKPEHLKELKNYCDGFIIGSAIINKIKNKESVTNFLKYLTKTL
ncbi:MAG: tryptophan synthase subunit alpha [Elusimicrobia bacterium RIFOXYD2_FULL_34_30]|nr:MAG: tryptophan synthase subunit alpha [Elusimicrobia bacterium RIFOXYD2_FULL_34_30]